MLMPAVRALFAPMVVTARASYHPLRWLIPLALLHGLLFLAIVPPWQHYDEPPHFEYAWLIANHGHIPSFIEVNPELRREVADSMYGYRFYPDGRRPDLLVADGPGLGENQRVHPPLYYALAALPLRLASGLAVDQQLYLVRALSLAFYVLTIIVAWRVACVVVPDEPLMQLAMPLLLMLTPTFVDIMTGMNNDVLVNFCAAALLLGCVLLIREGPRPLTLLLATLALGVALSTKRTAVILIIPYLASLTWAWRREALRAWAVAGALVIGALALAAGLEIGRAADGRQLLTVRPWLDQFDTTYLRLYVDDWVRSVSDVERAGELYPLLLNIGFTSFWVRFGWGGVVTPPWVDWAMVTLCALCGVGLLLQGWRARGQLPLWQRRCIWLFLAILVLGVMSMVVRLHPLPSTDARPYIPRGRYIFTAMLPTIWLLALGWQGLLPERWRPYGPLLLVGIWAALDIMVWSSILAEAFYRPV